MPAYLVIHARPHVHGQKIREFLHRPDIEPGLYVWENRELSAAEHNAVVRKVVERHAILRPYSRIAAETPNANLQTPDDPRDAQIEKLKAELARTKEALTATLTKKAPRNRKS